MARLRGRRSEATEEVVGTVLLFSHDQLLYKSLKLIWGTIKVHLKFFVTLVSDDPGFDLGQ